jgi:hypothetical protein
MGMCWQVSVKLTSICFWKSVQRSSSCCVRTDRVKVIGEFLQSLVAHASGSKSDSSVSVVVCYGLDYRDSIIDRDRAEILLLREWTPGTHCTGGWVGPRAGLNAGARRKILCSCRGSNPDRPARSLSSGFLALYSRIKQQAHKTNHSPSSSAVIKNTWTMLLLLHTSSWCGA